MLLKILHTNDLHGKLTESNFPALVAARDASDLFFDTGDCVKSGNLGVPLRPEPVWKLLSAARCDGSVIGNRETHLLESAFQAKLRGAAHPVLCANLRRRDGSRPLPGVSKVHVQGLTVGMIGLSVPMVTERMKTQAASAFFWDPPVERALEILPGLRAEVDFVFALTHIGLRLDERLADACPEIDVVFGGHSHTVLERPVLRGRTWLCQGGSHARYMGRYEWDGGRLTGGLVPWA